jgi:hypothetical protein
MTVSANSFHKTLSIIDSFMLVADLAKADYWRITTGPRTGTLRWHNPKTNQVEDFHEQHPHAGAGPHREIETPESEHRTPAPPQTSPAAPSEISPSAALTGTDVPERPIHQVLVAEGLRRYANHPDIEDVRRAAQVAGLSGPETVRTVLARQRILYADDVVDAIKRGDPVADKVKDQFVVKRALEEREKRGDLINAVARSQIERDGAYRDVKADAHTTLNWYRLFYKQPKRNQPLRGWKRTYPEQAKYKEISNGY